MVTTFIGGSSTSSSAIGSAAAAAALVYVLHLRSKPPAVAIAGVNAAIDREMTRWNAILT